MLFRCLFHGRCVEKGLSATKLWRSYAMQEPYSRNTFPRLRNSRPSGVFSVPWRVAPRLASPRLARCQAIAVNTWMTQESGWVTWPPRVLKWRHKFPHWRNSRRALFSLVSDQGLIGARSRVVLGEFSAWVVKSVSVKRGFMCNIWSVWWSETVIIPVLRSVARRRLVKTKKTSARTTVNWKLCK
jgi:hypothetical protein